MPPTTNNDGLTLALNQIERQFGKGSIMRLGEIADRLNIESSPTGSLSLDIALGIGGLPKGRVVELFGAEASGKTTLALHAVAEIQKNGGLAAFIDAEHALDPSYAQRIGVSLEELLISQPDYAEQALEITDYLVRSGSVNIIAIDSVAALMPKAELEGDMGDTHIGLQARFMSQALRKLTASIHKSGCTVIFINQLREKVGVVFGSPETTPGGRALKFYSSVRIDTRRIESIKQGNEIVGNKVRARVVKNKVAPPFKVAEFDIMFSKGISKESDLVDLGTNLEIIRKSGAFYSYGDQKLGQGRETAKQFLEDNKDTAKEIEDKIRSLSELPAIIKPPKNDLPKTE